MDLPIANRLKKKEHLDVAMLQDEVVEIMYGTFHGTEPVLHGGTAVWRCYHGNRFSEDLDFYATTSGNFKENLKSEVERRGLALVKYKETENTIFAKISNGTIEIRLELSNRKPRKKIIAEYEKANGTKIDVYSLPAGELAIEKAKAYMSRRLIRDIYDVYHLSSLIQDSGELKTILKSTPMPVDEKNLKTIVYAGAVPTFQQVIEILNARLGK